MVVEEVFFFWLLLVMPDSLSLCFSNFSKYQNQQEDWLKHRFRCPTPRVSDSIVLSWDLGIDFSNKFLRGAATLALDYN